MTFDDLLLQDVAMIFDDTQYIERQDAAMTYTLKENQQKVAMTGEATSV